MSWIKAGLSLRRGQTALTSGDLERALESFKATVAARPRWDVAHLWLATILSELGDLESARAELDGPLEHRPNAAVYRLWMGRILVDHRRFSEAVELFEEAFNANPQNVQIPGYLALAKWAESGDEAILDEQAWTMPRGGVELSARWLLEIEGRFPGGPGTDFFVPPEQSRSLFKRIADWRASRLADRAASAIDQGDHIRALTLLDRMGASQHGSERAMELRVEAHCGAATRRMKQLETNVHDVDLRLDVAEDLLEIGAPGDALSVLLPASGHIESIDPHRLSWQAGEALLRGRALLATDRPDDASEALSFSCELWPTEVEPLYYLAIACLRAGQTAQGRRTLIEACSVDSDLAQLRLDEYRAATS